MMSVPPTDDNDEIFLFACGLMIIGMLSFILSEIWSR